MILSPVLPVADAGHEPECTWLAPNPETCTPPPHAVVAWWTFDENAAALLAHDITGGHHGSPVGDARRLPGNVAGAWYFDGSDDRVRVPHEETLHAGTGALSIDAWVKTRAVEGVQTILDKRGIVTVEKIVFTSSEEMDEAIGKLDEQGFSVSQIGDLVVEVLGPVGSSFDEIDDLAGTILPPGTQLRGYHFFIENGHLAFELNANGATETWYGPFVGSDVWTFVAVTVTRDDPSGGTFYVNGVAADTFDPTPQQGSVNNFANAILGRFQAAHASYAAVEWGLDEVELFHRALGAKEISYLFEAQGAGKCKLPCENPDVITFHADSADPRPDFSAGMPTGRRDVGQGGVNRIFIHTFDGLPDDIVAAQLRIHLVGEGELDRNDGMGLQFTNTIPRWEWYRRIGNDGLVEGLLDESWGKFRQVKERIFVLDLSALPKETGTADLLPSLNANGHLDVYVQDDTKVAAVSLTIVRCNCSHLPPDRTLEAGVQDNFNANANNPEISTPSPELFTYMENSCLLPTIQFDDPVPDRCFGHMFVFDPGCIASAVLEIRLKGVNSLARNDKLGLGFDPVTQTFAFRSSVSALPEAGGSWGFNRIATFEIDIGAVAPGLLETMMLTGVLDLMVDDDTSVDYVRLHLASCCGEKGPVGDPFPV